MNQTKKAFIPFRRHKMLSRKRMPNFRKYHGALIELKLVKVLNFSDKGCGTWRQ